MRFPKRMLAWFLTLTMLCTFSGITAFAEDAADPAESEFVEAVLDSDEEIAAESETAAEIGEAADVEAIAEAGDMADAEETADPEDTVAPEESTGFPESDHNYANNTDETWTYTLEGGENGIYVTFDEQTQTESGYDFIYVYDGEDNEIGRYSGTELAGVTLYVPTATVKIRLTADKSSVYYGFKVDSITACDGTIDLEKVGSVDDIAPVYKGESLSLAVYYNISQKLTEGTDYTAEYNTDEIGSKTVTITGTGKYRGTLYAEFTVYDEEHLVESGVLVTNTNTLLRQSGETGTGSIQFENTSNAWLSSIESITLTPVDADDSATDTGSAEYPNAPKEITLEVDGDKVYVSGSSIRFTRTADEPVVYVMEGHEPIEIVGRWSTNVYPQSQIYKVTVKAAGYEDVTGKTTYYTGTSVGFSIIIDEDGKDETTDDRKVVKSWTSEEIEKMSTFANGSSQCGMTGFRTFSGNGVSLADLLKDAEVEVSDSDYFLLDTSDHYGNKFTYDQLFGTARYFMSCIYDEDFADFYSSLVENDDEAGSTIALRRYLADQCLKNNSTVEPRINTKYVESMVSAGQLEEAVLPTEENTVYNSLVSYENQYRFFYGIALVQEECTVTFDSQGGSDVAPQTVLSHYMTSTENTTIKSSYWANSLVIYRGAGEQYKTQASDAAKTITVPEAPTRDGYVFAGWYTDADCTPGNKFDFAADGGTVDVDTTLYAKWIEEEKAITVTDFDITNAEHDDADEELNQTIIVTLTFSDDIKLLSEDLSSDLLITIAGGDVNNTARNISYEVQNGNQLVIRMVSTDWVAIYNGVLKVQESTAGISNIVAADDSDKVVVVNDQTGNIPIGIVVNNDVIAGTASEAASTYAAVAHKANMRGMYFFQLVSIVDGQETVIGQAVSHAHNFYTTIDEAAIASAMASAINKFEGYSTVYTDGETYFIITADNATEGETLAVRMVEIKAQINYAHAHSEEVIENYVDPTATTDGSYDLVQYCSFCGEELSRETIVVPAAGTEDSGDDTGKTDPDDDANTGTDETNGPGGADGTNGTSGTAGGCNGTDGTTGGNGTSGTNGTGGTTGTSGTGASTGDTGNAAWWFFMFCIAGAGISGVICSEKKRRSNR
ncbi:MAG: InlB B-repeat-containing protein [Lachnospiraceae bacterium]